MARTDTLPYRGEEITFTYKLRRSPEFRKMGGSRYAVIISGTCVGWVCRWDRDGKGWEAFSANSFTRRGPQLKGTRVPADPTHRWTAISDLLFELRYEIGRMLEREAEVDEMSADDFDAAVLEHLSIMGSDWTRRDVCSGLGVGPDSVCQARVNDSLRRLHRAGTIRKVTLASGTGWIATSA